MARKPFDVEIPDGQRLGFSRDTDGAYRAHLFDNETGELVGHAELFEAEDHEEDSTGTQYGYVPAWEVPKQANLTEEELAEALEALVGLGIIVAALASRAAPRVKRWWNNTAAPALETASRNARTTINSAWTRVIGRRPEPGAAVAEIGTATHPARDAPTIELDVAFEDYRVRMSSEEARDRFVAALMARAFAEEQVKILRSAEIEGDNPPELKATIGSLNRQEVGTVIKLLLEKNPSLLEHESLAQLGRILGGSQDDDDQAPLRVETTRAMTRQRRGRLGP